MSEYTAAYTLKNFYTAWDPKQFYRPCLRRYAGGASSSGTGSRGAGGGRRRRTCAERGELTRYSNIFTSNLAIFDCNDDDEFLGEWFMEYRQKVSNQGEFEKLYFDDHKIYAEIAGKTCHLELATETGSGPDVQDNEYLAKFTCTGEAPASGNFDLVDTPAGEKIMTLRNFPHCQLQWKTRSTVAAEYCRTAPEIYGGKLYSATFGLMDQDRNFCKRELVYPRRKHYITVFDCGGGEGLPPAHHDPLTVYTHTPRPTPPPTFNLRVKVSEPPQLVQPEGPGVWEPIIPPTLSDDADIGRIFGFLESFGDYLGTFCLGTAMLPEKYNLLKRMGRVLKWLNLIKVCFIAIEGYSGSYRRSFIQADVPLSLTVSATAKLEFNCSIPLYNFETKEICPPDKGEISITKTLLDINLTHPIAFLRPDASSAEDEYMGVSISLTGEVKLKRNDKTIAQCQVNGTSTHPITGECRALDLTVQITGAMSIALTGINTKVKASGSLTGSATWKSIELMGGMGLSSGTGSWYDEAGSSWSITGKITIAFGFTWLPDTEASWLIKCQLSITTIADLSDFDWGESWSCTAEWSSDSSLDYVSDVVVDTAELFMVATSKTAESCWHAVGNTASAAWDGMSELIR